MLQNMQNKGKKSVDVNTHFTLLAQRKKSVSTNPIQNLQTSPLPGSDESVIEHKTD